jgi:hypothetical protein
MGFLLCFLGILAAVPLLIALRGADNQTSYYENRTLAAMPEYQTADLLSGAYFSAWDTWLTDHIPSRDRLLGLNTQIDYRLLQKPVVNDVVVAADVLLPSRHMEPGTLPIWPNGGPGHRGPSPAE